MFNKPTTEWFWWTSKSHLSKKNMGRIISVSTMDFVPLKSGAKHELLFNKPATEDALLIPSLRCVWWTSKSDLSITTKCDWVHGNDCYKFGQT